MVFIDWLTISQEHPPGTDLPVFASVVSDHLETDTGLTVRTYRGKSIEGSYSSNVLVRCDGAKVYVSGNPSRFGRPDALFGLTDIQAAVEVFSRVLVAVGLPELKTVEAGIRRLDGTSMYSPRVHRVDLTQNLGCGVGNERGVLNWVASQAYLGKGGYMYPNARTVDWNRGSRHSYFKYYDKGWELKSRGKKALVSEEHHLRLVDFCSKSGVVRHELSLKNMGIRLKGLDCLSAWGRIDQADLANIVARYSVHNKADEKAFQSSDVEQQLIDIGVGALTSRRLSMVVVAWRGGVDCRSMYSKTAFYRNRAVLLGIGIDIGVSVHAGLHNNANHKEVVILEPLSPPDWYREGSLAAVA